MNSVNGNIPVSDEADFSPLYAQNQVKESHKKGFGFAVGLVVIILSLVGVVLTVMNTVDYFTTKNNEKSQEELLPYNEFFVPVAAVDPAPFDDVGTADSEELIEIAVWGIIGSNLNPEEYVYTDKELLIPAEKIESSFRYYFGNSVEIKHATVTGYGYEFAYNSEDNTYYIPLTAVEPLYTPFVTEKETKGDTEILTVGLINSGAWKQDSETGDFSRPEPDKYIKITLVNSGNTKYISALRTSSIPETAIVDIFTQTTTAQIQETSADVNTENDTATSQSE